MLLTSRSLGLGTYRTAKLYYQCISIVCSQKCSSKTYPACSPWERQGIPFEAESHAGSYFRRLVWRIWWAWIPNIFETATGQRVEMFFQVAPMDSPPRQLAFTFTFPWCDCRRRLETGDELRIPQSLWAKKRYIPRCFFCRMNFVADLALITSKQWHY